MDQSLLRLLTKNRNQQQRDERQKNDDQFYFEDFLFTIYTITKKLLK